MNLIRKTIKLPFRLKRFSKYFENLKEFILNLTHQIVRRPVLYFNYLLIVLILILTFSIVHAAYIAETENINYVNSSNDQSQPQSTTLKVKQKPLQHYLKELRGTKLFQSKNPRKSSAPGQRYAERPADVKQALEKIKLLGIITGDQPEVIIRISGTEETQRFKLGDTVNGFLIKEIKKSQVILSDSENDYTINL
ncbi:MAG: hypothetical protein GY861_27165 [bacterium]|nr:hypothetical protein [bacterium]